jgi:hypothetical protein
LGYLNVDLVAQWQFLSCVRRREEQRKNFLKRMFLNHRNLEVAEEKKRTNDWKGNRREVVGSCTQLHG